MKEVSIFTNMKKNMTVCWHKKYVNCLIGYARVSHTGIGIKGLNNLTQTILSHLQPIYNNRKLLSLILHARTRSFPFLNPSLLNSIRAQRKRTRKQKKEQRSSTVNWNPAKELEVEIAGRRRGPEIVCQTFRISLKSTVPAQRHLNRGVS